MCKGYTKSDYIKYHMHFYSDEDEFNLSPIPVFFGIDVMWHFDCLVQ